VAVHEDSATTAHLVLPPSPQLTEAELDAVADVNLWNQTFVAGGGAGAPGVECALEHLVEVEALVDGQAGLGEPRQALLQGLVAPIAPPPGLVRDSA